MASVAHSDREVIISLKGASKYYGSFSALEDVSIELIAGEVHMLLGENGAGKSTLVSLLTGVSAPNKGERKLRGVGVPQLTPAEARNAGINAVMQDFSLAPSLTIEENFSLGREPTSMGLISRKKAREDLERISGRLGLSFDPNKRVSSLSRAEQQLLEIVRAVGGKPGALILDEPTATLSHKEAGVLFRTVLDLRNEGWAILYISHRMEEIRLLGDVVTTLRDGRMMGFHRLADVTNQTLISEIVGRNLESFYPEIPHRPGPKVLEVKALSSGRALREMDIHVCAGEIVGVGGLVGCGKSELGRSIFGLSPHEGEIWLSNEKIEKPAPREMLERGLVLLPQDRRGEALSLDRSISENLTIEVIASRQYTNRLGFLRFARTKALVDKISATLGLKTHHSRKKVAQLSGGNQQKVVLGRAISRDRKVFILEEPTSGVDVGARMDFYTQLQRLVQDGAAILLITSDMQELINLSHRAYIMHEGRLSGELDHSQLTEEAVASYAFGEVEATPKSVH